MVNSSLVTLCLNQRNHHRNLISDWSYLSHFSHKLAKVGEKCFKERQNSKEDKRFLKTLLFIVFWQRTLTPYPLSSWDIVKSDLQLKVMEPARNMLGVITLASQSTSRQPAAGCSVSVRWETIPFPLVLSSLCQHTAPSSLLSFVISFSPSVFTF